MFSWFGFFVSVLVMLMGAANAEELYSSPMSAHRSEVGNIKPLPQKGPQSAMPSVESETQMGSKKYNLSVCAIFKGEAKFFKEWIEYHLLVGVDHFYLYDNGSRDRYIDILRPYIKNGIVTLVNWPDIGNMTREDQGWMWALGTRVAVYQNAAKEKAIHETTWLVFLDVNEFLVPKEEKSLVDLLKKYTDYPGISMPIDFFDASKVDTLPRRQLLIETVELVGAKVDPEKEVAKTIFKPDQCSGFCWPPYECLFKDNQHSVKIAKGELRINRYMNRLEGHLVQGRTRQKIDVDNRMLTEDQMQGILSENYEVDDKERAIEQYIPDLMKKLGLRSWGF